MLLNLHTRLRHLLGLGVLHSIRVESLLSSLLNILHSLHGHDGLPHEVAIVFDRSIASLFEFEGGIDGEFLAPRFAVGLGPGYLAWIALFVEVAMAFGTAETEGFGVVAHEHDAVAGVAGGGAEVALFDAHFELCFGLYAGCRVE